MVTVYIGIDIGKSGSIALLQQGRVKLVKLGDDPARVLASVVARLASAGVRVSAVTEKTFAFKGMSAMSGHTLGLSAGRVLGVLEASKTPHRAIRPQEWKDLVLKGTDKSKEAAVAYVTNAYPTLDIRLPRGKPDHNAAEAVCMAEYAMRIDQTQ